VIAPRDLADAIGGAAAQLLATAETEAAEAAATLDLR